MAKKELFTLTSERIKDGKKISFEKVFKAEQALALLRMRKAQWKLSEKGYKFDGKEIVNIQGSTK